MKNHGVHSLIEVVGEPQLSTAPAGSGKGFRFGKLFPGLGAFQPTDASLAALGLTMTVDDQADPAGDSNIPGGYTYFGQFIDHDLTLDDTKAGDSELPEDLPPDAGADLDKLIQKRSPSLDLDSLYGKPWPDVDASLFEGDGLSFLLGTTTKLAANEAPGAPQEPFAGSDVPRVRGPKGMAKRGQALIGDPRNDENLIIQQIHLAFLKFHNKVARALKAAAPLEDPALLRLRTRELVTKHYQWLVLNDFVRRIVAQSTYMDVLGVGDLQGQKTVTPRSLIFPIVGTETPPMPLEFSVAAYRLGHSMVRQRYSWNKFFNVKAFGEDPEFFLFFKFTHKSGGIGGTVFNVDLETFPSNWIADWRRMFPLEDVAGFPAFVRGDPNAPIPLNHARTIDTKLAKALGELPIDPANPRSGGSLAARNLIRGSRMMLPSGQDVAKTIFAAGDANAAPISPTQMMAGLSPAMRDAMTAGQFDTKTPLWFYILREAELAGTKRLGAVGSRIVMEVFFGLIRSSTISIFDGSPTIPGKLSVFSLADSPIRTAGGEPIVSMSHLLAFVGDVNPLGD